MVGNVADSLELLKTVAKKLCDLKNIFPELYYLPIFAVVLMVQECVR